MFYLVGEGAEYVDMYDPNLEKLCVLSSSSINFNRALDSFFEVSCIYDIFWRKLTTSMPRESSDTLEQNGLGI